MGERCIACGMPMEMPDDHAGGDVAKDYCLHCARPDGTMQSYEEKLESMAAFVSRVEGLDAASAKAKAKEIMSELPAWKGKADS